MSGKVTKIADIRAKSADQLAEQVLTLRREQFNLRFQRANGTETNTSRNKAVRRELAKIKTVQGEVARAAAKGK